MKKNVIIGLVVAVVLVLIVIGFFVFSNRNIEDAQIEHNQTSMVDCGAMDNPSCFFNRMTGCLPVTGTMIATDGTTVIGLTIIGTEGNKCHYQRKINNVINQNCYFPIESMSWDLIDQTFGNDKGLQSVVDSSCTSI